MQNYLTPSRLIVIVVLGLAIFKVAEMVIYNYRWENDPCFRLSIAYQHSPQARDFFMKKEGCFQRF